MVFMFTSLFYPAFLCFALLICVVKSSNPYNYSLDKQCVAATSCASSDISLTDRSKIFISLECDGLQSCIDSSLTVKSYNPTIDCSGSYACNDSSKIEISQYNINGSSFDDSFLHLNCGGLNSCSNVDSLTIINGVSGINCEGKLSCSHSKMDISTIDESTSFVSNSFVGAKSAINSEIWINSKGYSLNEFNGFLSGLNSIIHVNVIPDDNNIDFVHVNFGGAFSGKNASVYCDNNNKNGTYQVGCLGNACNDINMTNNNNNDNDCSISYNCEYGELSDACPDGYNNELIYDYLSMTIPDLIDIVEMTSDQSTMLLCNNNDNNNNGYFLINCDDGSECKEKTFDFGNTNNNNNNSDILMCFTGVNSGYKSKIYYDFSRMNNISTIRCDASLACASLELMIYFEDSDIYFTIDSIDNSSLSNIKYINIYATASQSAMDMEGLIMSNSNYTYDNNDDIDMNSNGWLISMNIYCGATDSCSEMTIESSLINVDNLYCMAESACSNTNIETVNNVYVYASFGSQFSRIHNVKGSVYCGAYLSCYGLTLSNVKNSIYGLGSTTIEGNITNANNVYCLGPNSCYGVFTNVLNLYASGDSAVSKVDFHCNDGYKCNIICLTYYACDSITLNGCDSVNGTCNVTQLDLYHEAPSTSSGSNKKNDLSWIIIVIVTLVVIALLCGVAYYFYKKRKNKKASQLIPDTEYDAMQS